MDLILHMPQFLIIFIMIGNIALAWIYNKEKEKININTIIISHFIYFIILYWGGFFN